MNNSSKESEQTRAYNRMMERVKSTLEQAERDALPPLQRSIEQAKKTSVELGELTRDEAEQIGEWLRRDLQDAGAYLARTGRDLGAWLRFDVELVEERLLDLLSKAADQTRLQLLDVEERAEWATHYATGEVMGPGTLACEACGKLLHMHRTGHVPPCPSCHGTRFTRASEEQPG